MSFLDISKIDNSVKSAEEKATIAAKAAQSSVDKKVNDFIAGVEDASKQAAESLRGELDTILDEGFYQLAQKGEEFADLVESLKKGYKKIASMGSDGFKKVLETLSKDSRFDTSVIKSMKQKLVAEEKKLSTAVVDGVNTATLASKKLEREFDGYIKDEFKKYGISKEIVKNLLPNLPNINFDAKKFTSEFNKMVMAKLNEFGYAKGIKTVVSTVIEKFVIIEQKEVEHILEGIEKQIKEKFYKGMSADIIQSTIRDVLATVVDCKQKYNNFITALENELVVKGVLKDAIEQLKQDLSEVVLDVEGVFYQIKDSIDKTIEGDPVEDKVLDSLYKIKEKIDNYQELRKDLCGFTTLDSISQAKVENIIAADIEDISDKELKEKVEASKAKFDALSDELYHSLYDFSKENKPKIKEIVDTAVKDIYDKMKKMFVAQIPDKGIRQAAIASLEPESLKLIPEAVIRSIMSYFEKNKIADLELKGTSIPTYTIATIVPSSAAPVPQTVKTVTLKIDGTEYKLLAESSV